MTSSPPVERLNSANRHGTHDAPAAVEERSKAACGKRIAIVGAGRMGRERARAVAECGSEVVAVCEPDRELGETLARAHSNCRWLEGAEALDWDAVDAVFICTPPFARGPIELAAIAARTPFFVEKPLGLSAEHARPIVAALAKNPIPNAVGYMNRCRPSVRRAKSALAGQRVLGASSHWLCGVYRVGWWGQRTLSGGPLNEQLTHLIDLTRFLLGEIVEVQAMAEPRNWQDSQLQSAAVGLRLASGALHSIFYSCQAGAKWIDFEAYTPDACINLAGWDFQWRERHGPAPEPETDRNAIFRDETRAFLAALGGDRSLIACDVPDAFRTQQAVDAVLRALGAPGVAVVEND
jgi:predicted dehydrogenase